tara:strand:- start:17716 stop:18168 length:453 start_codon:yes stop_codon:yes gene_type:complete
MSNDTEPTLEICPDGHRQWTLNGQLHRLDGPAEDHVNGAYERWWCNGLLHRLDGPARIYSNGSRQWYVDGVCHREGKPAFEGCSGHNEWWYKGKLHRLDGPAVTGPNGEAREWWVWGEPIEGDVAAWAAKRNFSWPWDEQTQLEFLLTWI